MTTYLSAPRMSSVASAGLLEKTKDCRTVMTFAQVAAQKLWKHGAKPELATYLFLLPYLPARYCENIPLESVRFLHIAKIALPYLLRDILMCAFAQILNKAPICRMS